MAKSKIISASIAVDIQNLQEVTGAVQGLSKDLSNISIDKNLESRLKNVEKTISNVVKQIGTMTDKIDVLSKAGGLDPKTLNDLSLLTTAISDVKIEVDNLTAKVNNFSKSISDVGDTGIKRVSENITKEIGSMATNIDTSITNATMSIQKGGEKLKKAYEQLLQSVNSDVDVEGVDISKMFKFSKDDDIDAEFEKVKTKLQNDLKDLADTTSKYNELKINGASSNELTKAAEEQVNALNKLKKSFEVFYNAEEFEGRVGDNMTEGMTNSIDKIAKLFPSLQGEVYRTFDEMYDFIDGIMENISNDFTASINTIKESLKGVSTEIETPVKKTNTKTNTKSAERKSTSGITTDVVIKDGVGAELIAELKTVIDNLQKYVDKNPVELNAVISPTWGTAQTQKYLKSIREQLSKTKNGKIDEKLAERIYGLQDVFGADFSEALNKSISKLRDSLSKEGFSVGKLKIEDTAIKDFREQIANEIGAITVDINANILGTTVVDKDKSDAINKQFEELKALDRIDPDKIMDLVNAIKSSGVDLDYSDIYKDRLKQIIKGLVDGIYGSVPEALAKSKYPKGANPLIAEFNDNGKRIKEYQNKINAGASGDAFNYYRTQLEKLLERQRNILAELAKNVEDVPDSVAEEIKEASQKIDSATIEVATATININNGAINGSDNVDRKYGIPNDIFGYTKFIGKDNLDQSETVRKERIDELKKDKDIAKEIRRLEKAINDVKNIDNLLTSFMAELPYEIDYNLTRDKNGNLIYSKNSVITELHKSMTPANPASAYTVGQIHNHPGEMSFDIPSIPDVLNDFIHIEQKIHDIASELQKGVNSDLFNEYKSYISSNGSLLTVDYSDLLKMTPEQRDDEYLTRFSKFLVSSLFDDRVGYNDKLLTKDEETQSAFYPLRLQTGYINEAFGGKTTNGFYDENGKWVSHNFESELSQEIITQLNQLADIIKNELINESITDSHKILDMFGSLSLDTFKEEPLKFFQKVAEQAVQKGMVFSVLGNADQTASDTVNETANSVENTVKEIAEKAEATLTATRDELVKAANQKFAEILADERADNLNLDDIDALVKDLRLAGIDKLNSTKLATTTTTGRIVDAMLKGGYTSALEAFKSTTSHSEESQALARAAQEQSKLFNRFQKLYTMQTVQEKGTGSIKSIQSFVDAVRKSGIDFKVWDKFQDNEIGKLINSMLTEGYKTVAEAIAVRDGKPAEDTSKKNIDKATINVTNLIIKGQQNIADATQKISSANIEIKNGKVATSGVSSDVSSDTKPNNKTDSKIQSLVDKYNKNFTQKDTMSLEEYLSRQEKLLTRIAAIKDNVDSDSLDDSFSGFEKVTRKLPEEIKSAREAINELLLAEENNSTRGRYELFNSKKIYQTDDLHELDYALSGDRYQPGSARTSLLRHSTRSAKMNAYTTEVVHNHPSGSYLPSMMDIFSWFSNVGYKKSLVGTERKSGIDDESFNKFIASIVTMHPDNNGTKLSFDMSKLLSLNDSDRNELRDNLVYGLISSQIGGNGLKAHEFDILNHLSNGAFSRVKYFKNGESKEILSKGLSDNYKNVLDSLINYLKENLDLEELKNARAQGHGKDYEYLQDFKAKHIKDIERITSGEIPSVSRANAYIAKLKESSLDSINLDDSSNEILPGIQKYLDDIDETIASTTSDKLKRQLEDIRASLVDSAEILNAPLDSSNIDISKNAIQDIRKGLDNLDSVNAFISSKISRINDILSSIEYNKDRIKASQDMHISTIAKDTIAGLEGEFDSIANVLINAESTNNFEDLDLNSIESRVENLQQILFSNISKTLAEDYDVRGLIRKIDNLHLGEVKVDKDTEAILLKHREELSKAVGRNAQELLESRFKEIEADVNNSKKGISASDRTMWGSFLKELRHKNYQALAQFFSLNDIIRYMREAINVIKQYDTALIEMMKVSDETRSSLERYQATLFDTADAIGASALTLEQSTADWMRIGETLTEAAKSAKAAQILMNVSEFQDINSATQALVSASQAYAELDKMDIVDKINKLGNEFPIATDQLATALQNSAAALTTQGNDINEALALVVGGNVITQDALKTGTGIRTIALRIAGTKEAKDELAELGEGVDDFVVRTESKTRKLIMDYTAVASNGFKGVDIYNENGNLRSTYEIMQDIADIYKEIQLEDRQAGTNRANALVELLAGKNRSNIAASILTNPDTIREAYEAAQNAEGSAMRENEKYLTSVEAHMTQFRNAVQELITSLVDSGFINNIIDFGTKLVNILTDIIDKIGGVGTALTALGIGIAAKQKVITNPTYGLLNAIKTLSIASPQTPNILGLEDVRQISNVNDLVGSAITKDARDYLVTLKGISGSEKNLKIVENAVDGLGEAQLAAADATALHAAKAAALRTVIGFGVVAVIGVAVSLISNYIQKQKEAQQAARDLAKETRTQNDSLEEYAKRISNAKKVIADERSTTDEIIEAKKELVTIQEELNESYGNYNEIIKDNNRTLEENNRQLIANKQLKLDEAVTEAMKTGEDKRAREFFENPDIGGNVAWPAIASAFEQYFNVQRGEAGNIVYAELKGDNAKEQLEYLQDIRKQILMSEDKNDDGWLVDIDDKIDVLEEGIEKWSDIYLNLGENTARTKYSSMYNELEEAWINNVQSNTEESADLFTSKLEELYFKALENSDDDVTNWLRESYSLYFDNINKAELDSKWNSDIESVARNINRGQNHNTRDFNYELSVEDIISAHNGDDLNGKISDAQMALIKSLEDEFSSAGIDFIQGVDELARKGILRNTSAIDFDSELNRVKSDVLSSGFMSEEEFDKLGISTSEELDIWKGIYREANNATDAVKMYVLATSELGNATSASDILKDMQSQYKPVFDAMADAYKAIWANGKFTGTENVTTAQIESVRSQIESLNSSLKEAGAEGFSSEEVDAFILTLADVSAEEGEVQDAFNAIATTLVDSLNPALGQASGETTKLIQKTLTELGVTNAEEVIFTRLGFTAEEYANAKAVANENGLDLDKEIGALTDEELELIATNEALSTFYENRILYNSLNLETAEDISRLADLCDMLDRTAIGLLKVGEIKSRLANIDLLRSQGRDVMADFELKKLQDEIAEQAKYNPAEVKVDGNKNTSSTSGGGSPSPQDFDWIERVIKKIQRAVTNFGKIADATYKKWEERIGGITKKYENLQEEILIQQQAEQAYMAEANAIGLSETYASKVRDGLMDIETITDDTLKEQIQKYQEYYDKATDAADAVEDLRGEIASLAQSRFDNITKQFEEMALAIDHTATRIGHIQGKMSAEGYFESSTLIEQILFGDKEKLKQLEDEAKQLAMSIDEAVTNGDIEYGSEQWWGMYDSLQNVNDQIVEMKSSMADLNDQLRQMDWDNFDYVQDAVSRLRTENEFLIDTLETEQQLFEKVQLMNTDIMVSNGNWTDAAMAIQALHVGNMKTLEKQNEEVAESIKKVNAELANDPSNKKLLERRNDLIDQQQDIIKGITEEKQAIKSLVQEGYETFLDYLQKSIDKRKQILEAEKNLYDYERNIADQTKAIGDFQKQLVALGGDDSEENRARMQQLRDDLTKAEKDLQETEYERWLSDQEEMMDTMYESFENLINQRLDNIDALIDRAIQQTVDNANNIAQTIQNQADEFIYELDNTSFGVNFDARISDAVTAVNSVENAVNNMINAANINAQNELAQLQALAQTVATSAVQKASQIPQANPGGNAGGSGGSGSGGSGGTPPSTAPTSETTDSYDKQKNTENSRRIRELQEQLAAYKQQAENWQNQANRYTPTSPNRIEYQALADRYSKLADDTAKEIRRLSGFAKGGTIGKAIKSTGEDGIILARSGEEVLSLERVKQMQGLFKMMQPLTALNSKSVSNIGGNTTVNGMNVSFALPNVTSYEDFIQKAKKDPTFEKMVQTMTIANAMGKSKLSKYSV